jgi:hypothetical protein
LRIQALQLGALQLQRERQESKEEFRKSLSAPGSFCSGRTQQEKELRIQTLQLGALELQREGEKGKKRGRC